MSLSPAPHPTLRASLAYPSAQLPALPWRPGLAWYLSALRTRGGLAQSLGLVLPSSSPRPSRLSQTGTERVAW